MRKIFAASVFSIFTIGFAHARAASVSIENVENNVSIHGPHTDLVTHDTSAVHSRSVSQKPKPFRYLAIMVAGTGDLKHPEMVGHLDLDKPDAVLTLSNTKPVPYVKSITVIQKKDDTKTKTETTKNVANIGQEIHVAVHPYVGHKSTSLESGDGAYTIDVFAASTVMSKSDGLGLPVIYQYHTTFGNFIDDKTPVILNSEIAKIGKIEILKSDK